MKTMKIAFNEVRRWRNEGSVSNVTGAIIAGLLWLGTAIGLHAQPVIPSNQPSNQIACLGGCLTYSVEATGTLQLSYEWRIYTTTGYSVVPGETNDTIVLCNVPTNNTRLRVVVTDGDGLSSTSRLAFMTIILPPIITQQAIGGSVLIGQSLTQSVTATGATLRYQWYFNGLPMAGKKASSLVIANVQLTNEGDYHVVISNACGVVTSDPVRLTVAQDTTFTRITTGPLVTDLGNSVVAHFGDYNGDGFQDIFVGRYLSGRSCLYRYNGDGTFTGVTNNVFPVSQANYTGGNWADIDNDGRLDLHVVDYSGALPSFFALNNGDGSFTKMEFGSMPTWSVNLVDTDSDGLLDMFFARGLNSSETNRFFYRNLDGRNFRQVSPAEVGDLLSPVGAAGNPAWVDYDDDGWVDMFGPSFTSLSGISYGRCQMYHNDGAGRFVSVTNQVTQDGISGAIGVWGDYDNDGRVDLFVGAISGPSAIYRNLGSGRFERASIGVTLPDGAMLARWGDYDNDGFLDLVANPVSPTRGCALFRNSGNGTFTRITTGPIVTSIPSGTQSYDAGWLDYDNDGFLDLFVSNGEDSGRPNVPNFLHHNNGNSNAWLKVKLVGTLSNRDAVGAKVRVEADFWGKHRWQRRDFAAGEYGGVNNNPIAHFGLGDATSVETLRVEWPSGQVTELYDVAVRQHLAITEAPGLRATGFAQGAMQLQLTAHLGMSISLDVGSDLVQWAPWRTLPQTNRTMTVTDPEASQHPYRFYRARIQ